VVLCSALGGAVELWGFGALGFGFLVERWWMVDGGWWID